MGAGVMTRSPSIAPLIERYFVQRLMHQRGVSPHTVASYRDTFRLLLRFAQRRLGKPPSHLDLADLDAPFIIAFLDDLEAGRAIGRSEAHTSELQSLMSISYDALCLKK